MKQLTGAEIRQSFIDFFVKHGHTFVPSASLVPGGDATLLFTNAGMVQFKDVFLGTDIRPYNRAVNSQKCMRVAGKHNDLDDVGRDDSHHTFFEMLGNWSFGDYYKKEAITWAWELLTVEWGVPREKLWATYFMDDKGNIPMDEEARNNWLIQPGMLAEHVIPGGRKDNFWEMAETGPCGPCSEIHIDRGPEGCDKQGVPGHVCEVNGDCKRYLELWNLVFIQYNRMSKTQLDPLPAKHVDTGMGLERIVSIMQGVNSNYRTDLLFPLMKKVQELTGQTDTEREENLTPYRVIADHARTSSFLIADGVVPGNTGRNYICRMIIRRASRFGGKIGLNEPFLAKVADVVVDIYGNAYPELKKNRKTILETLTREEKRFHRTLESGESQLDDYLDEMKANDKSVLDGNKAFDLYATHGLPLELTRDILLEQGLDVDMKGFAKAMDEHKVASGAGKAMGLMGGEDVEIYRDILEELQDKKIVDAKGIRYDPYTRLEVKVPLAAIVKDGATVERLEAGEEGEIILPDTCFYIESGGQVSDHGWISTTAGKFHVTEMRKPAAGIISHVGMMESGILKVGEEVLARVDIERRQDIRRNHTATHLLHAWLHKILGPHAVQAGSLVAPDRLRFDFNHPEGVTSEQLEQIEAGVNQYILQNYKLTTVIKGLQEALNDGATALFGEKYGQEVRTISIGPEAERVSYELCGGTHVAETADIGSFYIVSEGSAAAGVRRIEAVTGRGAYELSKHRNQVLHQTAGVLQSSVEDAPLKAESVLKDLEAARKQIQQMRLAVATADYEKKLGKLENKAAPVVFGAVIDQADADILRILSDRFRTAYPSSVVILGCVVDQRPTLICSVTDDLVKKSVQAGEIVKAGAAVIGGSGGGRPNMAQAGGKYPEKIKEAVDAAIKWAYRKLGM
jgi:alanyl-tRNA synthetase